MPYTLDQLAADCHAAINSDNGPDGREAVRRHLETALSDGAFVAAHFGPDNSSPRKLLYQDPDYGFCIRPPASPSSIVSHTALPGVIIRADPIASTRRPDHALYA